MHVRSILRSSDCVHMMSQFSARTMHQFISAPLIRTIDVFPSKHARQKTTLINFLLDCNFMQKLCHVSLIFEVYGQTLMEYHGTKAVAWSVGMCVMSISDVL